jgi:hypothetical protein
MSGNALHRMFAFIHPHVKHVVTASLDVTADKDDLEASSPPNDPIIHLRRQAVRISQGEQVDGITAFLPRKP